MSKIEEKVDVTQEAAEEMASESLIGGVQLEVLSVLANADLPMPLNVLVERCDITPGGLSFVVDALRRKKLAGVESSFDMAGLVITDKGREAVDRAIESLH